jgi:uncharacterized protein YdeI (BOF family)
MSVKVKMAIIAALAAIVAAPALAGESKMRGQSDDAARPSNAATRAYGPTFLPHKGSVDDACNLPSSRCPNQLRDVN